MPPIVTVTHSAQRGATESRMNKNAPEFRTRRVVFKEEFIIVMQTQGINNHECFKLIVLEPTMALVLLPLPQCQ